MSAFRGFRGEEELDGCAAAERAQGPDAPAVRFDEVLHDREPEAGTPLSARPAGVGAVEPLEHACQVLGGDSRARIGYSEDYATGRRGRAYHDLAVGGRMAQGIVEEVGKDLAQGIAVR